MDPFFKSIAGYKRQRIYTSGSIVENQSLEEAIASRRHAAAPPAPVAAANDDTMRQQQADELATKIEKLNVRVIAAIESKRFRTDAASAFLVKTLKTMSKLTDRLRTLNQDAAKIDDTPPTESTADSQAHGWSRLFDTIAVQEELNQTMTEFNRLEQNGVDSEKTPAPAEHRRDATQPASTRASETMLLLGAQTVGDVSLGATKASGAAGASSSHRFTRTVVSERTRLREEDGGGVRQSVTQVVSQEEQRSTIEDKRLTTVANDTDVELNAVWNKSLRCGALETELPSVNVSQVPGTFQPEFSVFKDERSRIAAASPPITLPSVKADAMSTKSAFSVFRDESAIADDFGGTGQTAQQKGAVEQNPIEKRQFQTKGGQRLSIPAQPNFSLLDSMSAATPIRNNEPIPPPTTNLPPVQEVSPIGYQTDISALGTTSPPARIAPAKRQVKKKPPPSAQSDDDEPPADDARVRHLAHTAAAQEDTGRPDSMPLPPGPRKAIAEDSITKDAARFFLDEKENFGGRVAERLSRGASLHPAPIAAESDRFVEPDPPAPPVVSKIPSEPTNAATKPYAARYDEPASRRLSTTYPDYGDFVRHIQQGGDSFSGPAQSTPFMAPNAGEKLLAIASSQARAANGRPKRPSYLAQSCVDDEPIAVAGVPTGDDERATRRETTVWPGRPMSTIAETSREKWTSSSSGSSGPSQTRNMTKSRSVSRGSTATTPGCSLQFHGQSVHARSAAMRDSVIREVSEPESSANAESAQKPAASTTSHASGMRAPPPPPPPPLRQTLGKTDKHAAVDSPSDGSRIGTMQSVGLGERLGEIDPFNETTVHHWQSSSLVAARLQAYSRVEHVNADFEVEDVAGEVVSIVDGAETREFWTEKLKERGHLSQVLRCHALNGDGESIIMKLQLRRANVWEFYVHSTALARISERVEQRRSAIYQQQYDSSASRRTTERELRRLKALERLVAPLLAFKCYRNVTALFLPFYRHGSLVGVMHSTLKEKRQMGEEMALKLTADILRAVSALHQEEIVHCEIKPENLMLQNLDELKKRLNDAADVQENDTERSRQLVERAVELPLVVTIDFGRSIDCRLLTRGATFRSRSLGDLDESYDQFETILRGRPFCFEIDFFGIIATVYKLLFRGESFRLQNDERSASDALERILQKLPWPDTTHRQLWQRLFQELLAAVDQKCSCVIDRLADAFECAALASWQRKSPAELLQQFRPTLVGTLLRRQSNALFMNVNNTTTSLNLTGTA